MAGMTQREQDRAIVEQWRRAGPALERVHAEELRRYRYRPADADAVLDIGHRFAGPPRQTSGLVEMQRLFMKGARLGILPAVVRETPAPYGRQELYVNGDPTLLNRPLTALFCSVKCPGKLILETYDLARRFRREGVAVVSGFHSPMEQECLRILLRGGGGPAVWCLARGMLKRIPTQPADARRAVAAGRLALVTPFPAAVRRSTRETAVRRNHLVAALAREVVIAHAAPGSKMEALARTLLAEGKPVFTFPCPAHDALLAAGARTLA